MAVTPVLTTQFQIATPYSSSLFLFEDTTDYVGLGIALTDVTGAITVIRPDGVTWHVGSHVPPDIDPNVSLENNVIAVPLDVNGEPIEGTYTVTYQIIVTGAVEPGTWTSTYSIPFCLCDSDAPPEPLITWDISCVAAPVVRATDGTNYGLWTITDRDITIYAPPNAAPPYNTSYTSAGSTVNSGNNAVWAGLWTARLVAEIERDFGTHTVTYTLTSSPGNVSIPSASKEVVCEPFCNIRCCINEAYNRWQNATTTQDAARYGAAWNQAVTLLFQAWFESEQCASPGNSDAYIQKIKDLLACNDDCGDCSGDRQGIITPISGASSSYTFVNGTPTWTIVTEVGGVVTIGLTAGGANTLAGTYNTAVGLSGGMLAAGFTRVNIVTPGTPPLHSTTIGFTGVFPASIQQYTERFSISFAGGAVLVTRTNQVLSGTILQIPGTLDAENGSVLTWLSQPAVFEVADFYATPPAGGAPVAYKMLLEIINTDYAGTALPYTETTVYATVDGGSTANLNNTARITVRDGVSDAPMTWGALRSKFRSIDFQLIIYANA